MEYYIKHCLNDEEVVIKKNLEKNIISLDKDIVNVFQEKNDFPKIMSKPINLNDLTKYQSIIWRKKQKENKNIN